MKTKQLYSSNDQKFLLDTLLKSKKEDDDIFIWRLTPKGRIMAKVTISLIRPAAYDFTVNVVKEDYNKFKHILENSDLINFYIPNRNLLFQCHNKYLNFGELILEIPVLHARIERRAKNRLTVNDKMNIKVIFSIYYESLGNKKTQYFKCDCIDISPTGLSFFINANQNKYFETDDKIKELRLDLDGLEITCDCVIVNNIMVRPGDVNQLYYNGRRIGVKIIKIRKSDLEILTMFVVQYQRREST